MKNNCIIKFGAVGTIAMAFALSLIFPNAQAETKRACIRGANVEYRDCASTCNGDLADALLVCSANGNATLEDCFQACAATQDTCLDPYRDARQDCHDACFATYDAAESICRAACVGECSSDPVYLACLESTLVARYDCDAQCRTEHLDTKDERKACHQSFKTCINTCRDN